LVTAGVTQGRIGSMLIALMIPICLAAYGLAVLFSLFGQAYSLADFYRAGEDWYPGTEELQHNHRVAGWSMIILAVAITVWFFRAGLA
jgi:flagellar basal body-associated protein FliL